MTKRSINRSLLSILFAASVVGCAGTGVVDERDKAPDARFDGTWDVTVLPGARTQFPYGRWRINCGNMSKEFRLVVDDSVATMYANGRQETFVDRKGRFRFEISSGRSGRSLGGGARMDDGAITYIVTGNLQRREGKWVNGVKQFGNAGCKTSMTIKRRNEA